MLNIIGTPIGNIEDTSIRAVRTLCNSDVILAEDTRTFTMYYSRVAELYGATVKKPQKIISLHEQNEFKLIDFILRHIKSGAIVSLVSESGMPGISDPGMLLINQCKKENLPYTIIPGPTAVMTAAVASGIPFRYLYFAGFPYKKESLLKKQLHTINLLPNLNETIIVMYESPFRVKKTIATIEAMLTIDAFMLCRELTKKFEQVVSTTEFAVQSKVKGEFTLVFKCKN